jgi:hypothetical protein
VITLTKNFCPQPNPRPSPISPFEQTSRQGPGEEVVRGVAVEGVDGYDLRNHVPDCSGHLLGPEANQVLDEGAPALVLSPGLARGVGSEPYPGEGGHYLRGWDGSVEGGAGGVRLHREDGRGRQE